MQLKALPRAFYTAGKMQPAELSAKARERLDQLETWGELRVLGMSGLEVSRILRTARSNLYRLAEPAEQTRPIGFGGRLPNEYSGLTGLTLRC